MNRQDLLLDIKGMFCENCPKRIRKALLKRDGVTGAAVDYEKMTASVVYDADLVSPSEIISVIEQLDYQAAVHDPGRTYDYKRLIAIVSAVLLGYLLLQYTGLLNLLVPGRFSESSLSYGMLFVTGLLTSVHCIAMCGGINLTQSLPQRQAADSAGSPFFLPSLKYNLGRVCSYTAFGAVLGTIGLLFGGSGSVGFPVLLQGALKILAGIVMVLVGINMLGLFSGLRRFRIPVPKVFRKISGSSFRTGRPFLIGLLNGFMPCGPLQLMWVIALASGNPVSGALSMLFFAAGTVPLMLGLGSVISALGKKYTEKVLTAGSVLVIILGLAMFTQGAALSKSYQPETASVQNETGGSGRGHGGGVKVSSNADAGNSAAESVPFPDSEEIQEISSELNTRSYPEITVQAGVPVRWTIDAEETDITTCNVRMLIPEFGIDHEFHPGENVLEFIPGEASEIRYTCWMGMIYGKITVTE